VQHMGYETMTDIEAVRTDERNWGAEQWRQPEPKPGDVVLYAEHGRIMDKTDYRSHSFKLVNGEFGYTYLLVRHGAGDERIQVHYTRDRLSKCFEPLDSDARYFLLHTLLDVHHAAERAAREETAAHLKKAFVEGRLKKRKMPGRNACKVWVEPSRAEVPSSSSLAHSTQ
jgi:hypothetical protein